LPLEARGVGVDLELAAGRSAVASAWKRCPSIPALSPSGPGTLKVPLCQTTMKLPRPSVATAGRAWLEVVYVLTANSEPSAVPFEM